jgi:hypothetical protein
MKKVSRRVVDLSSYPDLVVMYLGMRVNAFTGIKTLVGFGPKITNSVTTQPKGLLLHEVMIFSLFPPHVVIRQYWRDFESVETWARSEPHRAWWKQFLRDSGGTAFWHETYFMRGGMEAIYDDLPVPLGLLKFAPSQEARGSMFSSRQRLGLSGSATTAPPVAESDLYPNTTVGAANVPRTDGT